MGPVFRLARTAQRPDRAEKVFTKRTGMLNIQEAIRSGKPFRRRGWVQDDIYVVYDNNDIVLTLATDPRTSIELDVQDILADDWYLQDDVPCDISVEHDSGEPGNRAYAGFAI